MKKLFLTLLVALFAAVSFAEQSGSKTKAGAEAEASIILTGQVVDFKSGEALAGVEVKLDGTELKTYTDFDGNFTFSNLKPGKYDIVSNYVSYERKSLENIGVNKSNTSLKIELQASK